MKPEVGMSNVGRAFSTAASKYGFRALISHNCCSGSGRLFSPKPRGSSASGAVSCAGVMIGMELHPLRDDSIIALRTVHALIRLLGDYKGFGDCQSENRVLVAPMQEAGQIDRQE